MIKFDSLLDGGEIKVKKIGTPHNGGVINKILIAATISFAIGGTALLIHNSVDSSGNEITKVVNPTFISSLKDKLSLTILQETKFPVYAQSKLINQQNKEILEKAGNFELDGKLADNQIARKVSQIQFTTDNYFLSLVSEGEGFRSHVYNDNIGYAFGNGWNISMQSKSYNEELSKAISKDSSFSSKIIALSGKISDSKVSGDYNNLNIQPQRAMQVAQLMSEKFEDGVISGIAKHMKKNPDAIKIHQQTNKDYNDMAKDMYNSLAPNEKASVLYHSYKVGQAGFAKYNNLLSSLITYGLNENKTDDMRKNVADKFTYKYKMNGNVLEDTRASVLVGSMFASKNAFGYLIGKNVAPRNMSSLTTALKTNNIDGSVAPGQMIIADPVGVERARIEATGKKINIEIISSEGPSSNIAAMRSQSKKTFSHMPYGSM